MSFTYEKAQPSDLPQLRALWQEVFDEKPEATELFFKRNLTDTHIYLTRYEKMPIAAVYLIDGSVNGQQAHYLCGASTLKPFRKRGIMTALIDFALSDAARRGDLISLLYPANSGLYDFYERLGYLSVCALQTQCFDRHKLKAECQAADNALSQYGSEETQNIFLYKNHEFTDFAIRYYKEYGVRAARSPHALALFEEEDDTANVFYFLCDSYDALGELLLNSTSAQRFMLSGKNGCPLLKDGQRERAGMAKPLRRQVKLPGDIYIGITLN